MAAALYFLLFATVLLTPGVLGDFRKQSLSKPPVLDIGDGDSIRIKVYPCLGLMVKRQLLTIHLKNGEDYKELVSAEISCTNFGKAKRELTQGYIGLGNSIFVTAKQGQPVMTIFKINKKTCHQSILTDNEWNPLSQIVPKTVNNKKECNKLIKNTRPRKPQLGSTTMVVRLDGKKLASVITNSKNKAKPKQVRQTSQGQNNGQIKGTTQTPSGRQTTSGAGASGTLSVAGAGGAAAQQAVQGKGTKRNVPQEIGPMKMISLDDDIEAFYPRWNEGVEWYLSETLVMTLQKLYTGLQGKECIRLVTINKGNVRLDRFKVACGDIQGLTMYQDLIKYQKAFVVKVDDEDSVSGYFNLPKTCLYRKYTIEQDKVKPKDSKNNKDCQAVMSGGVTGTVFDKQYNDGKDGLIAPEVVMDYDPNTKSPQEDEKQEKQENNDGNTEGQQKKGWFGLGIGPF